MRFEGIRKQCRLAAAARLLFAATQDQVVAKADGLCVPRQRLRRDHRGFDLRLLPFVEMRVLLEQPVGHHEAEQRIAQELQ